MAGAADWVARRIKEEEGLDLVDGPADNLLLVRSEKAGVFPIGVTGVREVISDEHVRPLFAGSVKPRFVVNVPSGSLWSGAAIGLIHGTPAAYGNLGELSKAASSEDVTAYRNKDRHFYEQALAQHDRVRSLELIFDHVFAAHLRNGSTVTIALIEAYNLSAEDVRNARKRFGHFDVALKMSSLGRITTGAADAASSMGAEAMMLKQLMRELGR